MPEEPKVSFIKKVSDIKTWQFTYAFLASIATLVGGIYAVYNHFTSEQVKQQQQVIIVREERTTDKKTENIVPLQTPSTNTEISPTISVPASTEIKQTNKVAQKPASKTEETKAVQTLTAKQETVQQEEDAFGIVRGNKSNTKPQAATKVSQVYSSAYVVGEGKPASGSMIKIRLKEDMSDGNIHIPAGSVLTGLIKVVGERVFIECTDRNGQVVYVTEKSNAVGIPLQSKIPDGLLVNVSNINK